jgi:hypothetical protein
MSDNILEMGGGFPGYATATTEGAEILMRRISRITKRVTQGAGVIGFMTSYELQMYAYNQYGNAGGYCDGYCFIAPMLQESYNDKKPVYWTQDNFWPGGTVSGVKIIPGSAARPALHLPPLLMPANACGFVHSNLTREMVKRYAPYGFDMYILANGGLYIGYKVRRDPDTKELFLVSYPPINGGHVLKYMYSDLVHLFPRPVDPSPFYYSVAVVALQSDDDIPIDLTPQTWHLYHAKHINATITPAHGTELGDGTYVYIVATPVGDRVLTEFTVQGVDHLEDGTEVFTDLPYIYPDPANIPDGYKDGQARYYYGPVHSDVYVTAVAEGIEIEDTIKAGIPQTIQMTSDECLMTDGSWALGDTNLPASVELSISDLGLISFYVPQDVYDGNPGGTYYLNVTFNGYSQTKGLTLLLTVEDAPAYGTVWEVLYDFPAPVRGIFQASNGTWYITTTNQIYKSTDLETFDACTLTGSVNTVLCQVVEIAGGKLVTSDRTAIWITDGVTDTFVRQDTWTIPNGSSGDAANVGGDPSSSIIWHTCLRVGGDHLVWARSSTTGAMTAELRLEGIGFLSPVPPRLLSNGNWFISLPSNRGYRAYIFDGTSFSLVVSGTQTTLSQNPFEIDSTGRITLIGAKSFGVLFSRYSDDNGATWSDELAISASAPAAVLSLKPNYFLAAEGTYVGRTADSFASLTNISPALDGSITCFALNEYDKTILAGTTGTTHNLYISRS